MKPKAYSGRRQPLSIENRIETQVRAVGSRRTASRTDGVVADISWARNPRLLGLVLTRASGSNMMEKSRSPFANHVALDGGPDILALAEDLGHLLRPIQGHLGRIDFVQEAEALPSGLGTAFTS